MMPGGRVSGNQQLGQAQQGRRYDGSGSYQAPGLSEYQDKDSFAGAVGDD
jgi:hypothetical protein